MMLKESVTSKLQSQRILTEKNVINPNPVQTWG
jgi:hypothetical protein